MAKNRTAIDVLSAIVTELMVLLLVVLAAGLSVSRLHFRRSRAHAQRRSEASTAGGSTRGRMSDIAGADLLRLLVLALPVAAIVWTVTHEELFRELHDYCVDRSQSADGLALRKCFYVFTCEYCFSHYVAAGMVALTGFHLLLRRLARLSDRLAGPRLGRQSPHQHLRPAAPRHPQRAAGDWPEGSRQRARGRRPDGRAPQFPTSGRRDSGRCSP